MNVKNKAAKITLRSKRRNNKEVRRLAKATKRIQAKVEKLKKDIRKKDKLDFDPKGLLIVFTRLIFFDLPILFKNLIASDINKRIYRSPGYFVDNPREFYEL